MRAVVTGTSSGIGRAIASRLLASGWFVTGLDRTAAVIRHGGFESLTVDLADAEGLGHALVSVGPAQALVHAAGVMRAARLGALQDSVGDELWRIHVGAAMTLANHLAPSMTTGGRIVLIGSRAATRGVPAKSQYAAAKAALGGLARTWAKELIARGITVNVVAPAATDTAMLNDPARDVLPPETPPLGRRIQPEEVAALVAYLLSPEAAAITGQEIAICGGASL